MKELPEEMKLSRWLNVLEEVSKEYPGHRTMSNVITNIKSRLSYYQKSK